MFPEMGHWFAVKDGDPAAKALFDRHYSKHHYKDGRNPKLFCGPGYKMVLMTSTSDALFVWRLFQSGDNQEGINCMVFRNESQYLSSTLILEAEELAYQRWPGQRFYTYVAADKVKSVNPGFCFKRAGWRVCGETKVNKLLIFEKMPPLVERQAA
jgi:hypothetical protein